MTKRTVKTKPPVAKEAAPVVDNTATEDMVNAAVAEMLTASGAFAVAADKAAQTALQLCFDHGNANGIRRVFDALGETGKIIGPRRQKSFRAWVFAHSPARRYNSGPKAGIWALQAKTVPNYVDYDLEGAAAISFLEMDTSTGKTTKLSNEKVQKRIGVLLTNTITKAIENGNWDGDAFDIAAFQTAANKAIAAFKMPESGLEAVEETTEA